MRVADMSVSEAVALKRLIQERHARTTYAEDNGGNRRRRFDSREVAARATGIGHTQLSQADAVISAAERDPEKFSDLVTQMDQTGNIQGAYRELQRRRRPHQEQRLRRQNKRDRNTPFMPVTGRDVMWAKRHKRTMEMSLAKIMGMCQGLEQFDLQMAISVCDEKERHVWAKQARACGRLLGQLAKILRSSQPQRPPSPSLEERPKS